MSRPRHQYGRIPLIPRFSDVLRRDRGNRSLGDDELTQIKKYAYTVADDERFSKTEVEWDFIVVSNELDAFAEREAGQRDRMPGLVAETDDGRVRVWVKTWAQIIEAATHRLKFVQQSLQYAPDRDHALEHLRRVHAKYLPEVFAAGPGRPETVQVQGAS